MEYACMALAVGFTVANGSLLHAFGKGEGQSRRERFFFQGTMCLVWAVLLSLLAILTDSLYWEESTLLFSFIYSLVLCAYQLFKTLAFSAGPIALTTLIANTAFLIPTAYGVFAEGEVITLGKGIGILLLLVGLVLCLDLRGGKKEKHSPQWPIFTAALFLAGGSIGIVYREFAKSAASEHATSMLLYAALLSSLFFFAIGLSARRKKESEGQSSLRALGFALLCGATGCVYIRLNLSLAAVIPSVIFFPVSNGATVLFSALAGQWIFKEELKPLQWLGIGLGLAALVAIGCL